MNTGNKWGSHRKVIDGDPSGLGQNPHLYSDKTDSPSPMMRRPTRGTVLGLRVGADPASATPVGCENEWAPCSTPNAPTSWRPGHQRRSGCAFRGLPHSPATSATRATWP